MHTQYFATTIAVEGFDKNGTVFVKATTYDEALQKAMALANPKPTDFVDVFAIPPIADAADTDPDFQFAPNVEIMDETKLWQNIYDVFQVATW